MEFIHVFLCLLRRKREERTRSVKVDLQYTYLLTYFSQSEARSTLAKDRVSLDIYLKKNYIQGAENARCSPTRMI